MSNKVLQLQGCEMKGSTFQSRKFSFSGRDISGDSFNFKIKSNLRSNLKNIDGQIIGTDVIFPFSELESLNYGNYTIEYWAVLAGIGTEIIAYENFRISDSPCNIDYSKENTFALSFPNETIDYTMSVAVINIGTSDGGGIGKSAYQSYLDTTSDNPKKTEEDWSDIKDGIDGEDFKYSDFTPEQIAALKVKGDPFIYSDFTTEQLALLKGPKGDSGGGNSNFKYTHFSLDDVNMVLRDLVANKLVYTSIFQNPLLNFLREMHNQYGLVVSLFTFNEVTSAFNISTLPTNFAQEVGENSDWLKFGFHALNSSLNYATETKANAKLHYDAFVTGILKLSNNIDSIDRMPRLHNFAGNLESCEGMRDTLMGVIGYLTADDTRDSYYLTPLQSAYINKNEKIFDSANFLKFGKTETRFESSGSVPAWLDTFNTKTRGNMGKELICFTHENTLYPTVGSALTAGMVSKITEYCDWVTENNYNWGFPQDFV